VGKANPDRAGFADLPKAVSEDKLFLQYVLTDYTISDIVGQGPSYKEKPARRGTVGDKS